MIAWMRSEPFEFQYKMVLFEAPFPVFGSTKNFMNKASHWCSLALMRLGKYDRLGWISKDWGE